MNALILLSFVTVLVSAKEFQHQLIGGKISERGRWPWHISLQRYVEDLGFINTCGGSLINERWVLMWFSDPTLYEIRLGMFQQSAEDYVQAIKIDTIMKHPDWSYFNRGLPHDLALLRLTEDADLDNEYIEAVTLASPHVDYVGNPDCFITGWGVHDRSSDLDSDYLLEANVPVLTNEVCEERYNDLLVILPLFASHVCVVDPTVEEVFLCNGDSGGPAQCLVDGEWHLLGVASRSGSPSCDTRPSVYTRITSYLDWINSVISQ